MLVLTRSEGERIIIDGGRIIVTLVESSRNGRAKIGIEAAPDVQVDREEVAIKKGAFAKQPPALKAGKR